MNINCPDDVHRKVRLAVEDETLVDELIAPLVACVRHHGLTPRYHCQGDSPPDYQLAFIIFADAKEAFEFLAQSAHLTYYAIGDEMALSLMCSPFGPEHPPAGKVTWHPVTTHFLVESWR